VVEEFELQRWAHPMFGRSEHVAGLIYSPEDHLSNRRAGMTANFLWFQEPSLDLLPENVRRYLETGVAKDLHTRFKCRVRTPWYKVPSVSVAPIAMLKRAHHFPRLVLNRAGVYTTDTAYRIHPRAADPEALVFSFINSLTALSAELEGRHYGGGVLELVPSEIERLLVPVMDGSSERLLAADGAFRGSADPRVFLRQQDRAVLGAIGLAEPERDSLFEACARLRNRRQRTGL